MSTVLIVGATSAIAHETAKIYAKAGASLFLVARDADKLATVAADLRVRGAIRTETYALDLADIAAHPAMLRATTDAYGTLDAALIAYGTLGDQAACEASVDETVREWTTNATSVIALLTLLANQFAAQKRGTIAVIGSVAGDRGRKSNYVYGAAKGAVEIFLSGLRGRLLASGVAVVTIKPGFVDTPMTAGVPKNFLFAKPEAVARDIHAAMETGKDTIYTPGFWRWIMRIIRAVPEPIFKKLSI